MSILAEDLLNQWWLPLALLGLGGLMAVLRTWLAARAAPPAPPPLPAPTASSREVIGNMARTATMAPAAAIDASPAPNSAEPLPAEAAAWLTTPHPEPLDPITGLPGRLALEDRLSVAAARAEQRGRQLALLCIDLDGFRAIHTQHGQMAGEAVLREVARRLLGIGRSTDALARLSGDQFVMMLDGDPDASAAALVADRIRQGIQRPYLVARHELRLTCSIGIVMHPEHGPRARLLAHADAALMSAKRAGGNVHCFFEQQLTGDQQAEQALNAQLRQALAQDGQGLVLHYQPKVDARRGHVTGVEALLRWQHPVQGLLHPKAFMPLAERYGQLPALSRWALQQACHQLQQWHQQGLLLKLSLNLSRQQLRQADLLVQLQETFRDHQVAPEWFTLEVSEADAMADPRLTARVFERLHALGVRLSIDDFGSAHASLPQLRYLPIVELKIDRCFVQDAENDSDAQAIVKGMVSLAHALDLSVVAEGVETEGQHTLMRRLGCDELQGFRFARPMPPEAVASWHSGQGQSC
jgi:diguanylate cyclase (GGDEF)-like protein